MDRRTIIKQISIMTGVAFVGGEVFLNSGCKPEGGNQSGELFSPAQITLLNEIGETILPATDTPGAKSVQIGNFMQKMVRDCYNSVEQSIFVNGLKEIASTFEKKYGKSFLNAKPDEREGFLNDINAQANNNKKTKMKNESQHYFIMMKQLTILGYFSSETGSTQALNYIAVPTKYDGSYPYKKGDKAWALN
jgi:hypothetical protein